MITTGDIDGTILHLKETIRGVSSKRVYGRKGDRVILVSTHQETCIVQAENGERFPAPLEKLTGLIIEKAAPDAAVPNKPISNRASASKKQAVPINQTSLF